MNIADRIQHLRKISGFSQEELADKVGVSRQTISKWEAELSVPDTEKVIILSDLFDVTTDYLLKGIEPVKEVINDPKQGVVTGIKENIDIILITVMYIGYIASSAWWYESQTVWATVLSVLVIAATVTIGIIARRGAWVDDNKYYRAMKIVFPLLSFAVLSLLYIDPYGGISPYPIHAATTVWQVNVIFVGLYIALNAFVFRWINNNKK